MQKYGLFSLSRHALRFYERVGYDDYKCLALLPEEQERMMWRLANFPALFRRNHGTLTSICTVAEAFSLMDTQGKA